MGEGTRLSDSFIHLGLGATAVPQPPFDGYHWYEAYGARHGDDGREGRLVSFHRFTEGWDSWEMHPLGTEVVLCTEGELVLIQELADGRHQRTVLSAGEYAINPPGVWHIADVAVHASAVFITAGEGTEARARSEFPVNE